MQRILVAVAFAAASAFAPVPKFKSPTLVRQHAAAAATAPILPIAFDTPARSTSSPQYVDARGAARQPKQLFGLRRAPRRASHGAYAAQVWRALHH